jgi:hypothetical protein
MVSKEIHDWSTIATLPNWQKTGCRNRDHLPFSRDGAGSAHRSSPEATVVTHELNKPFFEQAWARPRTIVPDTLSKSPKPAVFETVSDRKVMTDGTRTLELYHFTDSGHNNGTLIAYLPRERILYWGDGYNPPAGDDPRDPARTPEYGIDLYRKIPTE